MTTSAADIEKLGQSFAERGWMLIDMPQPQIVLEVRDAIEEKMRQLLGTREATLETYHRYGTDEDHDKMQWELSNFFWEQRYARKIMETNLEFFRRFVALDLHIQKRPYLRIARPGRPGDNIGYHRDLDYGATPYEVSCHMPLTDVDAEGCLRVLDGSHLLPPNAIPRITGHETDVELKSKKHQMGFTYLAQRLPSDVGEKMTRVPMRVGQLLVFSLALAHGQEVNRSERSRVSFDVRLVNSLAPINWEKTVSDEYWEEFVQSAMLRQARQFYANSKAAERAVS